jgi:hypothetical protein
VAVRPFPRDELPAQDRVGRHDRRHLTEVTAA